MIDVVCPECRQALKIPDHFAGSSGKCNHCGSPLVVPLPDGKPGGRSREEILRKQQGDRAWSGFDGGDTVPAPDGIRLGAGMIATEADTGGRARSSVGRVMLLSGLALIIAACVLPALVIGYHTETAPPEPEKKPVVPAVRGMLPAIAPVSEPPVGSANETPVLNATENAELVLVSESERVYHKATCPVLPDGATPISLEDARSQGFQACNSCGGPLPGA